MSCLLPTPFGSRGETGDANADPPPEVCPSDAIDVGRGDRSGVRSIANGSLSMERADKVGERKKNGKSERGGWMSGEGWRGGWMWAK